MLVYVQICKYLLGIAYVGIAYTLGIAYILGITYIYVSYAVAMSISTMSLLMPYHDYPWCVYYIFCGFMC